MAIPTLVQVATSSCPLTQALSVLHVWLPHPSLPANCLVVFIAADNTNLTGNFVVTDDKGNTWTAGPTNIAGGGRHSCFYAMNAASGTRHITVTFTGGTATYSTLSASEWYNVATSAAGDGSSTGNISTPVATGAITTTATDDLVLQCGYDVTGEFQADGGNVTKGTNFTWLSTAFILGFFIQYTVKATAGSITPSYTVTGTANFHTFNTISLALKSAAAGTAPPAADMRIVHIQHTTYPINTLSPIAIPRFPCTGNLLVISNVHTAPDDLVSVSDGNGNSWAVVPVFASRTLSGICRQAYAKNATTSPDMTGPTLTLNGTTTGDITIVMYDIANADILTPYSNAVEDDNTQSVPGDLTTVVLTPGTASGIALVTLGINAHAIKGMSGPTGATLDSFWGPEIDGGGSRLNEDNGWGHVEFATPAPLTFVFQTTAVSDGVNDWSCLAVAYDRLTPPPVLPSMAKFPKPLMRNVYRR